jgi:ribulose-5-phosphate 4-epimerase/fuculose-1-phosphate aldolase
MGGFLGTRTPVYDNAEYIRAGVDVPDMLIRNTHLGCALASHFADSESGTSPDHAVVLMRGHGLTVLAPTIQDCVLRAVYTQKNASIQTTSLLMHAAYFGSSRAATAPTPEIKYLSEDESRAALDMTRWSALRPWGLWLREVEATGLYVNRG